MPSAYSLDRTQSRLPNVGPPLRIAFLRHSLLSRGGDKMIVAHANYLAERGHEVSILTNRLDTVFPLSSSIKVKPLPWGGKLGTLLSAAGRYPYFDVIVADIVALTSLLSIRNQRRLVYFAQDYDEAYYRYRPMQWMVRALYRFCLNVMRVPVVAVSDRLADVFSRRFAATVSVVSNGIDPRQFYPDPDAELLDAKQGGRAVVMLARRDYRKGLDVGMDVLRKLGETDELEGVEVWAVGGEIAEREVPCRVRNFGLLDAGRLRRVMSTADVLLYPSRHEGLPLFVLEAMACGCAVVATTAVPCAEDERNALVAPVEDVPGLVDRLGLALRDPTLRARLVLGGLDTAKAFSLEVSQRRFEGHLTGFVSQCGTR